MSKTLVIPDVHNNLEAVKQILRNEGQQSRVIWLGDWFDSFNETKTSHITTAKFLRRRMDAHPDDVFILGNHDVNYITDISKVKCCGYTQSKFNDLRVLLTRDYVRRFVVVHKENNILFTHAGVVRRMLPLVLQIVDTDCGLSDIMNLYNNVSVSELFWAGKSRGGFDPCPGPLWADYNEDFVPINGVNQIFGHTPADEVRVDIFNDSTNIALDTHLKYYLVVEDADHVNAIIKNTKDNRIEKIVPGVV